MPHLILEHTNNIKENFKSLFQKLHQILIVEACASLENCKSRAVELDTFLIGNNDTNNAFVHLEIRLIEGRGLKIREKIGKLVLTILEEYFSKSQVDLNLQISVEITELPRNLYFKTLLESTQ